jgi:hypothetical protein
MSVHVGEIHTDLSARGPASASPDGGPGQAAEHHPGVHEEHWRALRALVRQRERRVCTEDSDD